MTTYTFSGYSVLYEGYDDQNSTSDHVLSLTPATLAVMLPDNETSFSYSIINPSSAPSIVDINSNDYQAVFDLGNLTEIQPNTDDTYISTISWGAGKQTTFLDIEVEASDGKTYDFYAALGGDALPDFSSATDFQNFVTNSVTGKSVPTGALAPGQNIGFASLPSVTTTQDDHFFGTAGADSISSGIGNDTLQGGAGNDYLDPGTNDQGWDLVMGGPGNDTIDFSHANDNGYYGLDYSQLTAAATFTLNGATDSGSVASSVGTDTIDGLANLFHWGNYDGGVNLYGTNHGDTFDITVQDDAWMQLASGAGADSYHFSFEPGGYARLNFSQGPLQAAHGVTVDLATGTIADDGHGNAEHITGAIPEISATYFNDSLTGSDGNDSFIPYGGEDTIDGGAGFDRVRYDRPGVDYVHVDLATEIATGVWHESGAGSPIGDGAFTHHLSNIEFIRGSRGGNDVMTAADVDTRFQAYAGDDSLTGGAGNDTLQGGDGNDTLTGGAGVNDLAGGAGNDLIDASQTDPNGSGDWVMPGTGQDTVTGSSAAFDKGNGLGIGWQDVQGSGGINVTVGANGSGTATSTHTGVVDSTFTYANGFSGTAEGDTFQGSANAIWEGWEGFAGDDTIHGGGGYDELLYHRDAANGGAGAVTVNFATGTATDGFGDTDTFDGIEAVRGTAMADSFIGSASAPSLSYRGLDGDDTITGTAGWDRADYSKDARYGGTSGIKANLATGLVVDGFGATDHVSQIDEIRGTQYGDLMQGGNTAATFDGLDGNDTLKGGAGNDRLFGGAGNDRLFGMAGHDRLFGDAGNDALAGAAGNDALAGGTGNDRLFGGWGNDRLFGGAGNDALVGAAGTDQLFGGAGNDQLNGGAGPDVLNGGAGTDSASYAGAAAGVTASLTNASANTGDAAGDSYVSIENLIGSGHDDKLIGNAHANVLNGAGGNDVIFAGGGSDRLFGALGNDVLFGGAGNDALAGAAGNDRLFGGAGDDRLFGGAGNDQLHGGAGSDLLNGGAGRDSATYAGAAAGVTASLLNASANTGEAAGDSYASIENLIGSAHGDKLIGNGHANVLNGGAGHDRLFGMAGNDTLAGAGGNDALAGAAGNDRLFGGAGNDQLFGGAGDDHISGGAGNDILFGGPGADTFLFNAGDGDDHIADFSMSDGDTLSISAALIGGSHSVTDALQQATDTSGEVVFTFDDGTTITLDGVDTTAGLADHILITG